MELLQLKYFRTVARLEHITRAAAALHISQPSLSKTIRRLEEELGTPLFDRHGKFIRLNDAGRIFLKGTEQALAALEDVVGQVQNSTCSPRRHISLAFLAASPLLPELLGAFHAAYQGTDFHLIQHIPDRHKAEFDVCISILPLEMEGIKSIPLLTEEIFLAVPETHPLAKKKSIRLIEAANEGFIHLKPGNALREKCDYYCRVAGFTPHILYESDNPATVRGLIRTGQGVGFSPGISWRGETGPAVRLIPIREPHCTRTIGLSWMENRIQSEAVQQFISFTLDYFAKLPNTPPDYYFS